MYSLDAKRMDIVTKLQVEKGIGIHLEGYHLPCEMEEIRGCSGAKGYKDGKYSSGGRRRLTSGRNTAGCRRENRGHPSTEELARAGPRYNLHVAPGDLERIADTVPMDEEVILRVREDGK